MQTIFVNNAQFSQVISGDGANQADLSSEVKRGGTPHRVEQHAEQRHENVENSSSVAATEHVENPSSVAAPEVDAEPEVPASDARANLLSKLAAELTNLQQEIATNPSTLTDEQIAALVKELQ